VAGSFFSASRPLAFAHRGGAGLAPENTLAAFDRGVALGVDGLELDVRLSADGVVVVHHDAMLDRTTNLTGPLDRFRADELARADAGAKFLVDGARPFAGLGLGVPTLAEVLARYPDVRVIIDMKVNTQAMAHATLAAVRAADAVERVCLGGFGRRVLHAARAIEPAVATSAARPEVRWALYRSWLGRPAVRPPYCGFQVPEVAGATRVVSPRFVDLAHRVGLAVQVWTVDAPDAASRLLDWGVDALITDRPDRVVPLCRAR
jgi:glycerophosphoryl diester phosphodiesterase